MRPMKSAPQESLDDRSAYKWSHSGSKIGFQCESDANPIGSAVILMGFRIRFWGCIRMESAHWPFKKYQWTEAFCEIIASRNHSIEKSSHREIISLRNRRKIRVLNDDRQWGQQSCNCVTHIKLIRTVLCFNTWNSKDKDLFSRKWLLFSFPGREVSPTLYRPLPDSLWQ